MGEVLTQQKISWEVSDSIGYLRFTDPPENSMDTLFFQELNLLTSEIIPKSKVVALIISGSGRHFSSGAKLDDLFAEIRNEKGKSNILLSNYHSLKFFNDLEIPVIAAIKGVCLGSAFELAMHCHFRLCANNTIFGLPETGFGLIPGLGGIPKLQALAGKARTIDLVLNGTTFNASDALKWNIADAIYPKKELMTQAVYLAKRCVSNYRKYKKAAYLKT